MCGQVGLSVPIVKENKAFSILWCINLLLYAGDESPVISDLIAFITSGALNDVCIVCVHIHAQIRNGGR